MPVIKRFAGNFEPFVTILEGDIAWPYGDVDRDEAADDDDDDEDEDDDSDDVDVEHGSPCSCCSKYSAAFRSASNADDITRSNGAHTEEMLKQIEKNRFITRHIDQLLRRRVASVFRDRCRQSSRLISNNSLCLPVSPCDENAAYVLSLYWLSIKHKN